LLAFINSTLKNVDLEGLDISQIANYDTFLPLQGIDSTLVGITDEDMRMDLIEIEVLEDAINLKFQQSKILAKRL